MSIIYVDSGAVGANNGTSWADAYTTIQAALTAWTTADVIHLASDHSEDLLSATLTATNDAVANHVPIYSVNTGTDVYEPATTAQFTATTGNITFAVDLNMHGVYMDFVNSVLFPGANNGRAKYTDCTIRIATTGSAGKGIYFQGAATDYTCMHELYNCTFGSDGATSEIVVYQTAQVYMEGCDFDATFTTDAAGLFRYHSNGGSITCVGCDFTNVDFNSGASYFADYNSLETAAKIQLINCKLPTDIVNWVQNGTNAGQVVELIATVATNDSVDNYEKHDGAGNKITTSTTIYADNGYTGIDGTTKVSHKVDTNANNRFDEDFYSFPVLASIVTAGAKTFTMELAHNYTANLTDQDVRMELVYLGTASSPLMSQASSGPNDGAGSFVDPLDAGTDLTASTAPWTGAGALTKQKISITKTVNTPGLYMVRLVFTCYEAAKSIYYDPFVYVS